MADGIREKGGNTLSKIKEKADSVISRSDPGEDEPFDDDYFNFDDEYPDFENPADSDGEKEFFSDEDVAEAAAETEELVRGLEEGLSEAEAALFDEGAADDSDLSEEVDAEDNSDQFDEAISDFKARRKRFFK